MKVEYYQCDICGKKLNNGPSSLSYYRVYPDGLMNLDVCIDCGKEAFEIRDEYFSKFQELKKEYKNEIKKRRKLEVEE